VLKIWYNCIGLFSIKIDQKIGVRGVIAMLKNTRLVFAEALYNIVENKPLDKITVKDIVDYCKSSRQTFYNYFIDKNDLIHWIFQNDQEEILQIFDLGHSWHEALNQTYQLFCDHKIFYTKIMKEEGQNSFISALFEYTKAYYEKSIVRRFGERELTEDLKFCIQFNTYGAVNMCRNWMLSGMNISPDKMSALIIENMPERLKRYFV